MLEIGVIVAVVAGAALVVGRIRRPAADLTIEDEFVDLPCPWCRAPTQEDDASCPACFEPFGEVA